MTVTVPTFRAQFTAFADPSVFDDNAINMYLGVGTTLFNADRWGEALDYGLSLFIAHHLVLMGRDNASVQSGGLPGTVQSIMNQKQVDKVSVGYDTQDTLIKNGDFWNMSTYGIRFLHLAKMMGAGGMLVGDFGSLVNDAVGWPGFDGSWQ